MRNSLIPALLCALGALPAAAQDWQAATELDLSLSRNTRHGNALNSSSGPLEEIEDYSMARIAARMALQGGSPFRLQLGLLHDEGNAETIVDGGDSDDTYDGSSQLSLQLGMAAERHYFGGFAAAGEVAFNPDDSDQDADYSAYGLEGAWHHTSGLTLSGQIGRLEAEAEDPETLSDAGIVALNAGYALRDQTWVSARAAYASGEQDTDSGSGTDRVDLLALGLEIERGFPIAGGHQASLYGAADWVEVREGSSSGSPDEVSDLVIGFGLRITFGAQGAAERNRRFAPRLPEFGRWLGAVPAVD